VRAQPGECLVSARATACAEQRKMPRSANPDRDGGRSYRRHGWLFQADRIAIRGVGRKSAFSDANVCSGSPARREQPRSDTACQIKSWLRMQLWQLSRRGLTSWHHRWSAARVARAFPLPSAALATYRGPSRDEDCADDRKNGGKYMCTARTRSTPKAAIGVPHRRGSVGRATPQQPGMSSALPSR
jgi:hypothetical protein